jgi:V8-like Glu-specific endopeptidase
MVVGCEAPDAAAPPVTRPIINGTPHTGDPAIMALLSFRGNQGARCTATLITPRLLLAAAHCLTETPGFERQVFSGNEDGNGTATGMLAVKAVVHDERYGRPRQGFDFSIIVLETPLSIRPVPLNRTPLEAAVGKTARYVGYGLRTAGNPGSGGVKRQNTAPLAEVSRLLLRIGPNPNQTCEGDSGGPLLMDTGMGEAIIGVASFVDAPACRNSSFYQRVDTQLAWIEEQIQKLDPGGMVAPADAGGLPDASSIEVGPPVAPDAGMIDAAPALPPPPVSQPETSPPATDSGAPGPSAAPDARTADAPRPPPPSTPASETTSRAGDAGGCSHAPGSPRSGPESAVALATVLVFSWISRRRRTAAKRPAISRA